MNLTLSDCARHPERSPKGEVEGHGGTGVPPFSVHMVKGSILYCCAPGRLFKPPTAFDFIPRFARNCAQADVGASLGIALRVT
jgi:hypothetical protein